MPCALGCLALFFPRVVIALMWLFGTYFNGVFQTRIWPVLGFIFMPFTTLAYAWAWHNGNGNISGSGLFVVILAALIDLGTAGGGASRKEVRRYVVVKRVPNEAR